MVQPDYCQRKHNMGRVIRHDSSVPVPVEQAQLIDPGAFRFSTAEAEAVGQAGAVIQELGVRRRAADDSLAVNASIKSRQLALAEQKQFMVDNPDPSTWEEGFSQIAQRQSEEYSALEMSSDVRANQDIEQKAFGEKAGIDVYIAATQQQIANDIQVSGQSFIEAMGRDDGSDEAGVEIDQMQAMYQEALDRKFPKDVSAGYMKETLQQGAEMAMFNAMNIAVESGTPEDIKEAEELIKETFKERPDKEFSMLNSLRAKFGARQRKLNEAVRAQVNAQAKQIGNSAANGVSIEAVPAPENELAVERLNSRLAPGGGIDQSDGVTFDSLNEKILAGELFTDKEMLEAFAGTEAGGMSADEYKLLLPKNEENAKLSLDQKDSLTEYMTFMDTQFNEIRSLVNSKVRSDARPFARSVVTADRLRLKKEIRRMVMENASAESIQTAIAANFESTSEKYIRGWWGRFMHWGVGDFTDAVLDETDTERQKAIISDMLKNMRETGDKPENFDDLIERFLE